MQDYKRSASLKFGRRASMTKSRDFEPTVLVSGPLQGNMHSVPHSAVLDAIKTGEVQKTSILGALSEDEEGEEDEENPRSPSTVRETRLSRRLLAYGQMALGGYLVTQIVISLLFFSRSTISELEVWKWTVLLLTLLSGRLIGRVLVYTMIFLLQMIFKDNGKILYVAYGVRRSAWNVIWCLQVLCVWTLLFNGRRKIVGKIPVKVNQILVCTQIATLVMAGKVIFIKILANAFHRKAYFERIRDAMFDHYVIERLSIPAYMLNRSSRIEVDSATTGIRGEPHEEVGVLATLSQGQLGVRTFQSIMRFVRSTKITTISTQQQRDVRSEEHGRDAARDIFKNVVPEGRHHMVIHDLFHFLEENDAERAFQAFESEEGVVTCESFENWLINVVRERKALALTLSDTKTAIRSLSRLLDWVVGVIVVLMCLFVLNVNVQKLLVVTSGSFLASLFVFGNTCKTVFESIIFLFVTHPFDVSDIIRVDGQTYVVEEMQLLSTILLAADNSKVYYSNNQLALKVISNYYRSPDQIELIDLALGWGTPQKKIEEMRACILRFLQANPEQWYPKDDALHDLPPPFLSPRDRTPRADASDLNTRSG
ncbi:mechanosensitive channel of small conductance [Klebsormidium nitens]|uniref:Mechanosensitive channel of small conductance n=1 Tax=Klebsormidium nitens TaxID=105231 RepID=A0A1Y1IIC2_KLENI|nr:mechanosensitive channel of small conductance [Klebsormidium nitens]|eukprot:GAQ90635.1 mechanosensitive channel of small conductance [Klebsormidium nitens]